ncbi:endoplasmic reticulum aminopeptidase 1-like [Ooceraea biroi]|nr:endoplasmic reticulum aminopeptidase 1-like [Ooceraea biroi]
MPEDVIGKWSFILYKESLVTYRKETNSSVHKREVALTVAHAMLHQLLDNAISPSWWSDLWLSEGLATLLHVEILDKGLLYY